MRLYLMLFFTLLFAVFGWADVLIVDVPISEFHISNGTVFMENGVYFHTPGAPKLPCRKLTIALPPGAIVESVSFHGTRNELADLSIPSMEPTWPLSNHADAIARIWESYEKIKNKYYSSDRLYPETYGFLLSKGGLRKYTLIDIVCFPFAYKPISEKLFYTPVITVEIQYRMPAPETRRAEFWKGLMNDITFDEIAEDVIYNWQDCKRWYKTDQPRRANNYTIILPASLQGSVDSLVTYRQSKGYDVNIVTTEYIESNVVGDDLVQKIRNYLRGNMADIEYVLLVGFWSDVPWRDMVPFNNDPDSPYNGADYSPIPSDLYYAELTDPDSLSWNSDRDTYYGEVFDEYGQPAGEDDPDYHADVHLGRIPYSTPSTIEDICNKTIAFDCNTDVMYKTASLLAGAVYYYANEDGLGNPRLDGAEFMEQLMDDGVLERSNAVYLYEKAGLGPCTYSCTDSLTRTNMISYWQSKGIMYECHHGNYNIYARKIWSWDDGDAVPEYFEMSWPASLLMSDVDNLDNDHPATSFLRSCLCGKPEVNTLGAELLHHGASAVISSSRIAWMTYADPGGLPYHFYNRLIKDTTLSHAIIGDAYDIARNDFMDGTGFWLVAYHYNLFGDPALHQYGTQLGVEESQQVTYVPSFSAYPNPTFGEVTIRFHSSLKRKIEVDVYDVSGRLVYHNGPIKWSEGSHILQLENLQNGIYFLKVKLDGNSIGKEKLIILR